MPPPPLPQWKTKLQAQCPEILLMSYRLDAADRGDSGHSICEGFSALVDSELLSLGIDAYPTTQSKALRIVFVMGYSFQFKI